MGIIGQEWAWSSGSLILAFVFLGGGFLWFQYRHHMFFQRALSALKKSSNEYQILTWGWQKSKELEEGLSQTRDRHKVFSLLRNVLAQAPSQDILGVWTIWEPNAFDGKDAQYRGREGQEASGRLSTYLYRQDGEIKPMPLENVESEEFYTKPRDEGRVVLLDPFYFSIEGEDVLMTTLALPIKARKKVLGVVGVDFRLNIKHIYQEVVLAREGTDWPLQKLRTYLRRERGFPGLLGKALDTQLENQGEILRQLQQAVGTLHEVSTTLGERSLSLANRSHDQAASVEEFSAALEEIIASIKSSADNAKEAEKLINRTQVSLEKGELVLGEMEVRTNEVMASSKEMAEQIDQIGEIAFSTNMLALNAAVEASRARGHAQQGGEGFAVIAGEIRRLAGRTTEIAQGVEKEITVNLKKNSETDEAMENTVQVVQGIINETKELMMLINDVDTALLEQHQAADEIEKSLIIINEATQETTQVVEDLNLVSEDMQRETRAIETLLRRFS